MTLAALLGLAGLTRVHLAVLRHASYLLPGVALVAGIVIGVLTLGVAYRRAGASRSVPRSAIR